MVKLLSKGVDKVRKGCAVTLLTVIIVLICLIVGAVIYVMPLVKEFNDTQSENGEIVEVTIPKGAHTEEIAKILKDKGLIKSVEVFTLKAKLSENGSRMNYGTFKLNVGMCIPDIIDTLAGVAAYRETVSFAVPEGFSVEQIAARCESLGFCTKDEFLAALDDEYDYEFVKEIPHSEDARYKLQGYLYPKTYEFYTDATAHDIIDRMLLQFERELEGVNQNDNISLHEAVIIASMVERECLLDRELKTIAGVMYNRLDPDMYKNETVGFLNIDACAQYVVTDGMYNITNITGEHMKVESPYNTYKVKGLPPGPICNVSVAAMEAAFNPESHEYLYYHTNNDKNDGSHIFTRTLREHNATM